MATIFFQPSQELTRILPLAQNRLTKAKVRLLGLRDQSLRTTIPKYGVEMFRTDARFAMNFYMRWELLWRSDLLDQTGLWEEYNELYDGLNSLEADLKWLNEALAKGQSEAGTKSDDAAPKSEKDEKNKDMNIVMSLDIKMPPKIEPGTHGMVAPTTAKVPTSISSGRSGQRDKRGRFHFGVHRMFTTA